MHILALHCIVFSRVSFRPFIGEIGTWMMWKSIWYSVYAFRIYHKDFLRPIFRRLERARKCASLFSPGTKRPTTSPSNLREYNAINALNRKLLRFIKSSWGEEEAGGQWHCCYRTLSLHSFLTAWTFVVCAWLRTQCDKRTFNQTQKMVISLPRLSYRWLNRASHHSLQSHPPSAYAAFGMCECVSATRPTSCRLPVKWCPQKMKSGERKNAIIKSRLHRCKASGEERTHRRKASAPVSVAHAEWTLWCCWWQRSFRL